MDDNPIPPLVDLPGKLEYTAAWARAVQRDSEESRRSEADKARRVAALLEWLATSEAAIVRAREVLGG